MNTWSKKLAGLLVVGTVAVSTAAGKRAKGDGPTPVVKSVKAEPIIVMETEPTIYIDKKGVSEAKSGSCFEASGVFRVCVIENESSRPKKPTMATTPAKAK